MSTDWLPCTDPTPSVHFGMPWETGASAPFSSDTQHAGLHHKPTGFSTQGSYACCSASQFGCRQAANLKMLSATRAVGPRQANLTGLQLQASLLQPRRQLPHHFSPPFLQPAHLHSLTAHTTLFPPSPPASLPACSRGPGGRRQLLAPARQPATALEVVLHPSAAFQVLVQGLGKMAAEQRPSLVLATSESCKLLTSCVEPM